MDLTEGRGLPLDETSLRYCFTFSEEFFSLRDFDVKLYLCNGAFEFLTQDVFERLQANYVLPLYIVFHTVALLVLKIGVIQKWR